MGHERHSKLYIQFYLAAVEARVEVVCWEKLKEPTLLNDQRVRAMLSSREHFVSA